MNIFGVHFCIDELNMIVYGIVPNFHIAMHYVYRLIRYLPGM